ncbi:1-acylglycerol-3-phosphate O-acyltransferase [Podochytrium sp. JEL0797]|nr:1-acylglycerol-3-phosphate O-acyltransferase [Podochytrium sp. JEL0797]
MANENDEHVASDHPATAQDLIADAFPAEPIAPVETADVPPVPPMPDALVAANPIANLTSESALPPTSATSSGIGATEILAILVLITAAGFRVSKPVRFAVRFVMFMYLLFLISVSGICVALYEKAVYGSNEKFLHKRSFHWLMHTLCPYLINTKFVLEEEGSEFLDSVRPCVFVMNHQSEMDILVLGSFIPQDCVVLMKEEFKKLPIIGQYVRATGDAVFIKRQSRDSAIETMAQVATVVKQRNVPVHIFPEGTRSYQTTNDLLPFKKGAFHLAVSAQIPIIPVVASSYHSIYNLKNLLFEGGVVRIKVLPPVSTEGLVTADVGELTEKVRGQMLATLKEISAPPPVYAKAIKVPVSKAKKDE